MEKFVSIIKNYSKLSNIKLKRAVVLFNKKTTIRYGKNGVSTQLFGNVWFNTPRGQALFKIPEDLSAMLYDIDMSNIRQLNEILLSLLAKHCGINCADYETAKYHYNWEMNKGIISYNFLAKDEQIVSFAEFCEKYGIDCESADAKSIVDKLTEFNGKDFNVDIANVKQQIFEIVLFDTLSLQSDRNLTNIAFIVNPKTNSLRLAPLHDNEYGFMMSTIPFGYINYEEVDCVSKFVEKFYDTDYFLQVLFLNKQDHIDGQSALDCQISSIVNCAKSNNNYKNILIKIINNFDLETIYQKLQNKGYKIDKSYKEFTIMLSDYVKKKLIKEFEATSIVDDELSK